MPKDKVDWISVYDNSRPQYISPGEVAVSGRMTSARIYSIATAPTVNFDGIDSLGIGQVFYKTDFIHDTLNGRFYQCQDNSACSAAWILVGSQDGMVGTRETDESNLSDGRFTLYNADTDKFEFPDRWDDLKFPVQQAILGSLTKPDYDFVNMGLLFPQNSTTEYVVMVGEFPHWYKLGSDIVPHVHYIQTAAALPTFTLEYRWYNTGDTIPAYATIQTTTTPVITTAYSAPRHQKLLFPTVSGAAITKISSITDMKLYRQDNVVTGDVLYKEFDIHYLIDSIGSESAGSKT